MKEVSCFKILNNLKAEDLLTALMVTIKTLSLGSVWCVMFIMLFHTDDKYMADSGLCKSC